MSQLSDISKLSLKSLNELALQNSIDVSLPKNAKIIAICHCLNISPCSDPSSMLSPWSKVHISPESLPILLNLTPKTLFTLTGWSSDLQHLPTVDDSIVKQYLLDSEILDIQTARTYKLSRPYKMQPFVHSVMMLTICPQFCTVRARCNPSQSTKEEDVKVMFVVLDKTSGQPCIAYCTCTVG